MPESAPTLVERRMRDTMRRAVSTARQWTAAEGLAGFTIERLCEEIGISRRTFFNYFASKENAVLGIPARDDRASALEEAFVASGPRGSSLLDDLVRLTAERWAVLGIDQEELPALRAAFEREPRLLSHLLELITETERADVVLVARREGWGEDDPRAHAAVQLVGAIVRASSAALLAEDEEADLAAVLRSRLDVFRSLLAL